MAHISAIRAEVPMAAERTMAKLVGVIRDAATTPDPLPAKVQVLTSSGHFAQPADAVLKVGPGHPYFYSDGRFEVAVPVGGVRVRVERGTEYLPLERNLSVDKLDTVELDLPLERWTHLPERGWFPGNTHIHYDEKEKQRDRRLRLEGPVHDFSVTVVSVLRRWDLDYASNHFPIGVLNDYSTAHHLVDIGEENRHNQHSGSFGYGHVMFLRIRNLIQPVSRGMLVDNLDPDYPPLCFACDDAREQGGIVLWCHNGQGMEAPVAAALGKLDGFNLFDPFWMDPEYEIWYRLLNCGFPLPASTGSDWFVCSNNRVYVQTTGPFTYDAWIDGLKAGRTFITNGPSLLLQVDGNEPGAVLDRSPGAPVEVQVALDGCAPVHRVELIQNGEVVVQWDRPQGTISELFRTALPAASDGWLAARCFSHTRDSFLQELYAHTSPIYLRTGLSNPFREREAAWFLERLDETIETWIGHRFRYNSDRQRAEVRELFQRGRAVYAGLRRG
jgi:hypothetical protein